MSDLYQKHRPTKWNEMVGQADAVAKLRGMGDSPPHAMMFVGHSGCGKTTAARILKDKLGVERLDFLEMNAADEGGINAIRDVIRLSQIKPLGRARLIVIDEAHQLTAASQNALLKTLEDAPVTTYFVLCTTNPSKIIKTIETRCTVVKFGQIDQDDLKRLCQKIAKKEGWSIDDDTLERISDAADGSARKAVVLLQQVAALPEGERAEAVQKAEVKALGIDLCRKIINPRVKWPEVAAVLKKLDEDPEGVRRLMLAYLGSVLLNRDDKRVAWLMNCLREPLFDGASAKALLALACWEGVQGPS